MEFAINSQTAYTKKNEYTRHKLLRSKSSTAASSNATAVTHIAKDRTMIVAVYIKSAVGKLLAKSLLRKA